MSDIFEPISQLFWHILRPAAELLHELRLVEIRIDKRRMNPIEDV